VVTDTTVGQRRKEDVQHVQRKGAASSVKRGLRPIRPCAIGQTSPEGLHRTASREAQDQSMISTRGEHRAEQSQQQQLHLGVGWPQQPAILQSRVFNLEVLPQISSAPFTPSSVLVNTTIASINELISLSVPSSVPEMTATPVSQATLSRTNTSQLFLPSDTADISYLLDTLTSDDLPTSSISPALSSQTANFMAGLQNAIFLGITLSELVTTNYRSPFYRPSSPADSPSSLLAAASSPSFPENLQPTLPQILFPHHAYLDIIPFPQLRARAITLMSANPPLFNPSELKRDIFLRQGLLYLRDGDGEYGGGRTWDMESWKILPWFARKWRMLMTGDDDGGI
jgi:hypothetical protein